MSTIGLRNIKTAFSVFLCVALFQLFHRHYPFYACIAAVSCTKECFSSTYSSGKYRFIGTCIGAMVGITFYCLFRNSCVFSLFCGIGIVLTIYLCNILKKNGSIIISCIVFIAIMTNLKGVPSLEYAINRIIDTFIGIVIAILVDKFLNFNFFKKLIHKYEHKKPS